ncbi:MAG: phosphatidylserine/phosphatidylglycerophosphate/cardiolipin synthase family protein [Alphaproteobacteria bacterium]
MDGISSVKSAAEWRFYLSTDEAWEAMYQDCANAKKSIEVEQYILEKDALGRKFLELFIKKAEEGIRVFVVCDKFGSFALHGSRIIRRLRRKGARFYFYHPITYLTLLTPWRWFPRTHVKTLLVDETIVYAGGVCIAARMKGWRDTQIRITGPIAAQVRVAFHNLEQSFKRKRKRSLPERITLEGEFTYLQNRPKAERYLIYDELIRGIGSAEKYIYISTAFFAPNKQFRRLITEAAQKGVEIRLLVPDHSDVPFADWVCLSYAQALMDAGVRMYHYKPAVLHNKTMIIDDRWATVGSTNMDVLSFFHNRESNVVITHKEAVLQLKDHFMNDLKSSELLTANVLAQKPAWKIAMGYLGRILKVFY